MRVLYVLKNLFSSIDNFKENVFKNGSINNDYSLVFKHDIFHNNIERIHTLANFGIITSYDSTRIQLNDKYLVCKHHYWIDLDLNKVTQDLYTELIQFKTIFNLYFETFILPLYNKSNLKLDKTLLTEILRHYTFNYTPTFERIFKREGITRFLHGRISSDSNQIVLGINEIPYTDVEKKYFIPFTKYFQKLNNNTDYKFLNEFYHKRNANYIFYFWGHSLDSSDADYINEIFNFILELKSKIRKIVVIYHNENSKSNMLINLLNIRGKKDIESFMRSDMLVFVKTDSLELKKELKRNISTTTISPSTFV